MKKMILMSLLMFSKVALAANLSSFQNQNFATFADYCGWHAEVSGAYLTLAPMYNAYSSGSTADCWGLNVVVLKCQGRNCIQETNFDEKKDRVVLLDDGNFVYMNADGVSVKFIRQ